MKTFIFFRIAALALLLLSFYGPWGLSEDGVPSPEWCDAPNFLVYDPRTASDHCVRLLPGSEGLQVWWTMLPSLPEMIVSNTRSPLEIAREMLFFWIYLLLLLPIASTLIAAAAQASRKLQAANGIVWALALLPAIFIATFERRPLPYPLWGIWLYLLAAIFSIELGCAASTAGKKRGWA